MSQLPAAHYSSLLVTHPVLLCSSRSGRSNTISPLIWYVPLSQQPALLGVSLRPSTQTYRFIRESGDFILSIPDDTMVRAVHFCAVTSGRETDKLRSINMPTTRGKAVSPLYLSTCLANIECRVRDIYHTGDRPFITGEVLWITVDDNYYNNGWLPHARLLYYLGGAMYRSGEETIDVSSVRPGYVTSDMVL